VISSSLEKAKRFYERYAPFISLGCGCLARALSHHGVDFAPKAIAILALAWMLPAALARFGPAPPVVRDGQPAPAATWWQRVARFAGTTVVVALFRNVLFFLVPIWFGSATITSINILFPVVLAAMALFTCFGDAYRARIEQRAAARTIWTAVILFAALVPAAAVVTSASPRVSAGLSAAIAIALAVATLAPRGQLGARAVQIRIAKAAAAGALTLVIAAPILPPVPVVCHESAMGTGVRDREPEGVSSSFPPGTHRLYGWFAVTLPSVYRQGINFQWYRDGKEVGRPITTTVTGGRKEGFRTWSTMGVPGPGRWRVDVLTDAGQLVCRQSARVERSP